MVLPARNLGLAARSSQYLSTFIRDRPRAGTRRESLKNQSVEAMGNERYLPVPGVRMQLCVHPRRMSGHPVHKARIIEWERVVTGRIDGIR